MSQIPLYPPQQHDVVGPDDLGTEPRKITRPWLLFVTSLISQVKAAITGSGAPGQIAVFDGTQDIVGDAHLTWDKTLQQQAIAGNSTDSSLVTDKSTGNVIAIGQDQGTPSIDFGMQVVSGVEIAEAVTVGYIDKSASGMLLGSSTGETPGFPTTFPQWAEWDVVPSQTELKGELVGLDLAGAIPGKNIGATRNAAGAGAASTLSGQLKDGRFFAIWVDRFGVPRYNIGASLAAIRPTEDGSVSDTSGFPFTTGQFSATTNIFSRRGDDGRMGVPGRQGIDGATGPAGQQGPTGLGTPGRSGDRGRMGVPGPSGQAGGVGPSGPQGVPGPQTRQADGPSRVIVIQQGTTSAPSTSNPEVPIVVTTNSTIDTNFGWVVPESLEISGGISLEISGGARLEVTGAAIPIPAAFVRIAENNPSGVTSTSFTNLGAYTHLMIVYSARSATAANNDPVNMQINGDTGANYDVERLRGVGTTASAAEVIAGTSAQVAIISAATSPANVPGVGKILLSDYRNTTFQKGGGSETSFKQDNTTNNMLVNNYGWAWRSTAAITRIDLMLQSGSTFVAGSKFTLYGML